MFPFDVIAPTPTPTGGLFPGAGGSSLWLFALIALIVVAGVVVALLTVFRRREGRP